MTSVVQVFTRTGSTRDSRIALRRRRRKSLAPRTAMHRSPAPAAASTTTSSATSSTPRVRAQRRLLELAAGREPRRATERPGRASPSRAPLQQPHRRAGRLEFQRPCRLLPPETDQRARQNNLLASAELTHRRPSRWQHRFTGFEYNHRTARTRTVSIPTASRPFGEIDSSTGHRSTSIAPASTTRATTPSAAGRTPRSATSSRMRTVLPALFASLRARPAPESCGVRAAASAAGRLSVIAGARFVHNETFRQ